MALVFPFLPLKARRALKARWSLQLLDALGVRLRVAGTPPACGLLVANHVSWLDIYVINASVPTAFVAKDDVRAWPLIGWLCKHTETIFMARGSRNAAMLTKERLVETLRQRTRVGVFPEGTTSGGEALLPFHSALFQSAIDAGTHVAPVALRYCDAGGGASRAPAYAGETTLWQSLRAIAATGGLTAHIVFLPVLDPAGMDRRQLAEQARDRIDAARNGALEAPGRLAHDGGDALGAGDDGGGVLAFDHHAQ